MRTTRFGYALLGLALTACGGGGGGGGSSGGTDPAPSNGMQLSFAPAALGTTVYQGESDVFEVKAQAGGVLPAAGTRVNAAVIDSSGVFEHTDITRTGDTTFTGKFVLSRRLSAGTHSGAVEVRVCEDDPLTCAKPVSGSPWRLRYQFNVRSQTDARELAKLPDVSNYAGSPSHNALTSATLDPSKITRRWSHDKRLSDRLPALGGGRMFVITDGDAGGSMKLAAYSERDGSAVWGRNLDEVAISAPTFADDRLYVITRKQQSNAWRMTLRGFNAETGAPFASLELGPLSDFPANPVVKDGKVYLCKLNEWFEFALVRVDGRTLAEEWSRPFDWNDDNKALCTPAVDSRYAYVPRQNALQVIDVGSGQLAFSIPGPAGIPSISSKQAPVLGPNGRVYVNAGKGLIAFDTDKRSVAWHLETRPGQYPVARGDAVYLANESGFVALSAETGKLLWSWSSMIGLASDLSANFMIFGNHALVSNGSFTQAVDLGTRQAVWSDQGGGSLALSPNGALYVQRQSFIDGFRVFNLN